MPDRHGRHWTPAEITFAVDHFLAWGLPALARSLGRTPKAIDAKLRAINQYRTQQEYVTSGQAAKLTGYSQQYLTELARAGRIKARRMLCNPLRYKIKRRWWWLFDPAGLPVKRRATKPIRMATVADNRGAYHRPEAGYWRVSSAG